MSYLLIRGLIGAATLAMLSHGPEVSTQRDLHLPREPGLLLLQGPGSDIGASVRELRAADQRPQGQGGVVIEEVTRGGPADIAGLRAGDIVTEFDSERFADSKQFSRVVLDTPPGRSVKVVFWRDGRRRASRITPIAATPE